MTARVSGTAKHHAWQLKISRRQDLSTDTSYVYMFVLLLVDASNEETPLVTNAFVQPSGQGLNQAKIREACNYVHRLILRWGRVRRVLPLLPSILTDFEEHDI
jgi:hypothetical protein